MKFLLGLFGDLQLHMETIKPHKMRVLVLALVLMLMMMSSASLAANVKSFAVEIRKQEQLVDNQNDQEVVQDQDEHTGTTLNNHHYIPRQDFSGHDGGNG